MNTMENDTVTVNAEGTAPLTDVKALVARQRTYFNTGETLNLSFRLRQLKKLKEAVIARADALTDALACDLGRSKTEGYLCDVGPVIMEINEAIAGLQKWAKPETHFSGLLCFPSMTTKVYKMPYGVTLIISPFNFPILLTLGVLAASIAGGNTAVLKTSSKSPACTTALKRLIADTFPPEYVTLVDGGHDVADACLDCRFDKIFYTGSPRVARHVLEKASQHLTPVALELGGETGNWAVVTADADVEDTARKIAFFKGCNAGQICINVNQVAVASSVADRFVEALKKAFVRQLGERPEINPEYPCLINESAYDKCALTADAYRERIVFGGNGNRETCRYAPTVIYPVKADEEIVMRELFCPLLPIVPFEDGRVDEMLSIIAEREHPLALYLFTKNKRFARRVMTTMQYGGGCVNEVCVHLMVKGVPFNGVGHSGMGAYHGEWGFREFTHPSTVLYGKTHFNLSLREHPYTGKGEARKSALIRFFEK